MKKSELYERSEVTELLLKKAAQIKLVVCDLDGTLLNGEKEISQRNLDAIAKASAAGVAVTICSGRIFTMLEAYVRTLNLKVPLISSNGAVIAAPDGTILRGIRLDTDDCYKALTFVFNEKLDCIVVCDEACYFTAESIRVKYFIQYNTIAEAQNLDLIKLIEMPQVNQAVAEAWVRLNFPQFEQLGLRKLLIYDTAYLKYDIAEQFLKENTKLTVSSSDPGLLDIVAQGVDKGTGLALLAEHFSLKPEEVMVIGDYDNDITMFEWAGFPVAMENAVDEIKERAIFITESNLNDGVAHAIEALILPTK